MNCIRTKVVPRRTRHGSGLGATRHDGSFLFVFFRLSSASGAVAQGNSFYLFARFTTVDPICAMRSCDRKLIVHVRSREHAIRDGSNWYAYCNSDPVNFVDAWGLDANDKGGNGNNGFYGERYHNGKYVMTVDVNNPEAFDAALSAYLGVRKYGAAGTTPVDSIALTNSSGQIIHTFSNDDSMIRYANANTTPTSQQTEEIAFSFGIGGKAALLLGIGLEVGVIVDKSFNIYLYGSASIGLGIQTPAVTNGNLSISNYMRNSVGKQSSLSLNPSKIGFSTSSTADISLGIGGTYDLNNLNNSGVPNAVSFGNVGGDIWETGTIIAPIFKRD